MNQWKKMRTLKYGEKQQCIIGHWPVALLVLSIRWKPGDWNQKYSKMMATKSRGPTLCQMWQPVIFLNLSRFCINWQRKLWQHACVYVQDKWLHEKKLSQKNRLNRKIWVSLKHWVGWYYKHHKRNDSMNPRNTIFFHWRIHSQCLQ